MNRLNFAVFGVLFFLFTGCEKGTIPVLISDAVDGVNLPQYTPLDSGSKASIVERYLSYGTNGTRINAPELNIKYAYKSSDEVTHIVLRGQIDNGIPEGLLWSSDTDPASGTYGVPSGTYGGRGDFKIGTLSVEATGGSVAIGSLYFDPGWVMGGFYTAVVLEGIVDNTTGMTITETNESLRLFSEQYRDSRYPDDAIFSESADGKMQRKNTYIYDPNNFRPWPDPGEGVPEPYNNRPGAPRGGYYILISKKANPPSAFLKIEYADGSKKNIEIDYSEVELREKVPLTAILFQNPSPALNPAGTYSVDTPDPGDIYAYYVTVSFNEITMQPNGTIPKPLYLRPLYEPLDIDPKKTTTNMISKVYARDDGGNLLRDDNLVIKWDDVYQAINVYYKEGSQQPDYSEITIHADLSEPFDNGGSPVFGMTCRIAIQQ
ncbi:MAG: hypothetical protein LBH18_05965 [Spirochaetaceae bacterium]|jgi:hypothetical protein|nr:hypothetical protein [Spirochaetaceae bacterium]